MFSKVMDVVFGCRHSRYSFPITIRAGSRRAKGASRTGTYVVCLDCGREFNYDWQEMRVSEETARRLVAAASDALGNAGIINAAPPPKKIVPLRAWKRIIDMARPAGVHFSVAPLARSA